MQTLALRLLTSHQIKKLPLLQSLIIRYYNARSCSLRQHFSELSSNQEISENQNSGEGIFSFTTYNASGLVHLGLLSALGVKRI